MEPAEQCYGLWLRHTFMDFFTWKRSMAIPGIYNSHNIQSRTSFTCKWGVATPGIHDPLLSSSFILLLANMWNIYTLFALSTANMSNIHILFALSAANMPNIYTSFALSATNELNIHVMCHSIFIQFCQCSMASHLINCLHHMITIRYVVWVPISINAFSIMI